MPTYPLPPTVGWRAGPRIAKVGKLNLLLTSCNTQGSWPCTSPEQHSKADPADGVQVIWLPNVHEGSDPTQSSATSTGANT